MYVSLYIYMYTDCIQCTVVSVSFWNAMHITIITDNEFEVVCVSLMPPSF